MGIKILASMLILGIVLVLSPTHARAEEQVWHVQAGDYTGTIKLDTDDAGFFKGRTDFVRGSKRVQDRIEGQFVGSTMQFKRYLKGGHIQIWEGQLSNNKTTVEGTADGKGCPCTWSGNVTSR